MERRCLGREKGKRAGRGEEREGRRECVRAPPVTDRNHGQKLAFCVMLNVMKEANEANYEET